jgi:hypothetical protein
LRRPFHRLPQRLIGGVPKELHLIAALHRRLAEASKLASCAVAVPQKRDLPFGRIARAGLADRDHRGSAEMKRSDYSHSIVPGGFEVTSLTTRLVPRISLTMRIVLLEFRRTS